jgi:hypothetical protein
MDNRADWGPGPWDSEPDHEEWVTAAGYRGYLKRNHIGSWCGYVILSPGHPFHAIGYNEAVAKFEEALKWRLQRPVGKLNPMAAVLAAINGPAPTPEIVLEVHGGITFTDWASVLSRPPSCAGDWDPDYDWVIGFDASHAGDLSPGLAAFEAPLLEDLPEELQEAMRRRGGGTYRTIEYMRAEVERLAVQLATIAETLKLDEVRVD